MSERLDRIARCREVGFEKLALIFEAMTDEEYLAAMSAEEEKAEKYRSRLSKRIYRPVGKLQTW